MHTDSDTDTYRAAVAHQLETVECLWADRIPAAMAEEVEFIEECRVGGYSVEHCAAGIVEGA